MRVDESDTLRFRSRAEIERPMETGTPFWRIVGAVFVALCLFGVLQIVLGLIVYRVAMKEVERVVQQWQREAAVISSDVQATPRRTVRQAPRLPAFPGPIAARKTGTAQACIGGYVSNRLSDGWSQTRVRCRASTQ